MKRILLCILCMMILVGCQSRKEESSQEEKYYKTYQEYINKLESGTNYLDSCDECDILLILNKTNNQNIRYDIIIQNPKVEMKDIKAIAEVDSETKYNPPSIGLLEEDSFSLIPGVINKQKGIYKGINLSGITSKKEFFVKVYMTFKSHEKKVERYIKLYANET